ncbi:MULTISPECIES: flagellar motor switch protein FliN [Agrobacterium]|uniref:Flagellar motor switch protein FliN n=1 Tax=Agrobacterium tumefaciens TaxID=358 RepID=Q6QMS3_AGRTU|nr:MULTISPECIES: flagellar motor switch protein FliN [Agrobacterium]AAS66686.1 FliN [Agrobacterium tumefaciens]ADY63493.1 flagellar motor switch protein FliN [Agrobacterium tumefaciens]NSL22122.1 flagellar motor switch protein FliN [Agrobacterium tumefaciens]NTB85894.1 flagellar motor switch protein FliN [Agrobacterium tumefaciens]NTC19502.1 flagellar motor switch protein FliN [Agrobacterium tumefaciens]
MATKKTPVTDDMALPSLEDGGELDQAIGDLRGVLKTDAEGSLSDFGDFGDFGSVDDASADSDLSAFDGGAGDFAMNDFAATPQVAGIKAPLGSGLSDNMDLIMDIPIDVQIVLGTSRMLVSGLMSLEEGATIALDRKIGEPVEIMVNGRRIARGEITVLEDDDTRFGVKLIEVMSTRKA